MGANSGQLWLKIAETRRVDVSEPLNQRQIGFIHAQGETLSHATVVGSDEDTIAVHESDSGFASFAPDVTRIVVGEALGGHAGLNVPAFLVVCQNSEIDRICQSGPSSKNGHVERISTRIVDALVEIVVHNIVADADQAAFAGEVRIHFDAYDEEKEKGGTAVGSAPFVPSIPSST
ncbi:hypothetical protein NKH02_21660 [Mesorhizobium sp. M1396]